MGDAEKQSIIRVGAKFALAPVTFWVGVFAGLVTSGNHGLDQTDDQAEHETARAGDENSEHRSLIGLGR
jgi:hypothetical protein